MATTHTNNGAPTLDAAFQQARELNEQVLTAARQAGSLYVDSYEKTVDRAIEMERKVGRLSQQEWLGSLIDAHIDVARELTNSYTTVARSLLK